jgi:hypothetical protein
VSARDNVSDFHHDGHFSFAEKGLATTGNRGYLCGAAFGPVVN